MGNVLAVAGGIEFGSSDTALLWIVVAVAIGALVVGWVLRRQVLEAPEGTEKMREIALAVQEGSAAYLRRQFRTIAGFAAVLAIALFFLLPAHVHGTGLHSEIGVKLGRSFAFVLGAGLSALTGFTGMWLAVRANVRVANAARESGYRRALTIAFRAGGVAGMFTVGLGLLGAGLIVLLYHGDSPLVLEGLAFGAALIAMFMRVGGGIFTKAADVGADLVGKVEQNIPEDDPRNAATIADNVGDNVGDCAGMAADLFESYQVTLAAAIILGLAAFGGSVKGIVFPLLIMGVGVLVAVVGILAVTPRSDTEHGQKAINRGFLISAVLAAAGVFLVAQLYLKDLKAFWAVLIGIVLAGLIQYLTEYFTSTRRRPVQEIAEASTTGPATVILSGFSTGLESAVYALVLVALAIIGAFLLGGSGHLELQLYYVALVGMGLLSTVGVIVSMDTFGPVSDNAQGIAEMSGDVTGAGEETLKDLDAIGNTTKASTKGVAIATAVIAATSLFGAFADATGALNFLVPVNFPDVLVGMLIGGSVAFMFSALAIRAVSRAAGTVVVEVRNQFRNHPGIMDGTEKPDYSAVVDICTQTSLRELVTPGMLAVLSPIAVGFFLKAQALGGFLAGAILTGQLMAVALSNSGGAWDNAKKLIEEGNYGGKGSENHKATVIGDTVGDPFKDTAGPALNPLIKVMNLVSLLIVPVIVSYVANGNATARIVVAVIATALLVGAIWYAKSRKPIDLTGSSGSPPTTPAVSAGPSA
ncbi:MAG TPA: sodium-translocating pyrophosphatase [Actinomycetota bacterium]